MIALTPFSSILSIAFLKTSLVWVGLPSSSLTWRCIIDAPACSAFKASSANSSAVIGKLGLSSLVTSAPQIAAVIINLSMVIISAFLLVPHRYHLLYRPILDHLKLHRQNQILLPELVLLLYELQTPFYEKYCLS